MVHFDPITACILLRPRVSDFLRTLCEQDFFVRVFPSVCKLPELFSSTRIETDGYSWLRLRHIGPPSACSIQFRLPLMFFSYERVIRTLSSVTSNKKSPQR